MNGRSARPRDAPRRGFDTEALPYHFVGDVEGADVWILMLISNVGPDDRAQEGLPYFSERLRANLRRRFEGCGHPLLSLDPRLRDTGTYAYYNRRNGFAKLIDAHARRSGTATEEARREVAARVAVVQLFPYRSTSGVPDRLLETLPSARLAVSAAREAVGGRLVVVPRSAAKWGFPYGVRRDDLFTFRADQARAASLMPGGACGGGDAILERLSSVRGRPR